MQVVEICREQFNFVLPSIQLLRSSSDLVKFLLVWCCFDCCILCYHFTVN